MPSIRSSVVMRHRYPAPPAAYLGRGVAGVVLEERRDEGDENPEDDEAGHPAADSRERRSGERRDTSGLEITEPRPTRNDDNEHSGQAALHLCGCRNLKDRRAEHRAYRVGAT